MIKCFHYTLLAQTSYIHRYFNYLKYAPLLFNNKCLVSVGCKISGVFQLKLMYIIKGGDIYIVIIYLRNRRLETHVQAFPEFEPEVSNRNTLCVQVHSWNIKKLKGLNEIYWQV